MASATERAFAIPEILEQILFDCDLNTTELFRWQNVSRSFYNAINGSAPLLRTMEILHKPSEEKKYRVPNPILWTAQLELWTFYRIEVLAPASPKNGGTGWKVNVHIRMNIDRDSPLVPVGVKSSRFFINPLDGSWRRMKVTRFPVLIEVPMHINYGDVSYEEMASDVTGEMTLGDLANVLENVRSRSEDEHRTRAAEFEQMRQDEEDLDRNGETAGCQVS